MLNSSLNWQDCFARAALAHPGCASDAQFLSIIVVSVTHRGIVSKRLNAGSRKQRHVIAQGL